MNMNKKAFISMMLALVAVVGQAQEMPRAIRHIVSMSVR